MPQTRRSTKQPPSNATEQPPPSTTKRPPPNATRQPPLNAAKQPPLNTTKPTHRTRAATEGTTVENESQKRKAKDLPPAGQPAKRSNTRVSNTTQAHHLANVGEPILGTNAEPVEQFAETTRKLKATGRKVPVRPPLSSDSDDREGDVPNQATDGDATSPLPSEDETDEVLTTAQLSEEYPVAVRAPADDGSIESDKRDDRNGETAAVRPNGGKRVERLIREIPIPGPSFQQPENGPDHSTMALIQDVHPPTDLFSNPTGYVQPSPGWPASTELIRAEDGFYKQTGQIIEINNCLSAAVKRANSNLVLINSFPGIEDQERWLADALKFELSAGNQSHVIKMVGERARVHTNYFNCLLSMIRNRWSGYRQSALNTARELVCPCSDEEEPPEKRKAKRAKKDTQKSLYGISGSKAEKAAAADKLLDHEAFHFARTSADVPDSNAPYQHQAMFVMLGYFFKGDTSLKSRVPTGEHGPEVPEPMVALAATLLEVALTEVAEEERMRFSEDKQRDRYFGHLNSFERVKLSKKGDKKIARLLSTVYKGTILELSSKGPKGSGGTVPKVLAKPTLMNADLLPV